MKPIFLLFTCSIFICSCTVFQLTKHKNKEKLVAYNRFEKFGMKKNTLTIKSSFANNEQYDMALDLGAGLTTLLQKSGLNYLETLSPVLAFGKTISADNKKTKNNFYMVGTINTNTFKLTNAFLPAIPNFQASPCNNFSGVWGADTFDGKILILKMEDSTMAVFDTLPLLNEWTLIESTYKYPFFYVTLEICEKKIKLLFDSGCSSGIVVSKDYIAKNLPEYNQLISGITQWTGKAFITASGQIRSDTTFKAIINKAKWGSYSIDSIPILMNNTIKRNVIGMEVFKRFNILLDYKNEKIYIQNNPNYKNPTTKSFFVKMGFSVINSRENLISVAVLQVNSPAEKAGLKVGDQVLSINNIKSDPNNNCEIVKIFSELDSNNSNNEVVIKRGDETLKFVL